MERQTKESDERMQTEQRISSIKRSATKTGPSLYEDARDMVEISGLVYVFAKLRRLDERGVIETNENERLFGKEITHPVDATEIFQLVWRNGPVLQQEFGEDRFAAIIETLKRLMSESRQRSGTIEGQSRRGLEVGGLQELAPNSSSSMELVAFDDEKHQNELVYGITVNHNLNRITVVFRGTVTKTDLSMVAKFGITGTANPIQDDRQPEKLGVHRGIRDYLFRLKAANQTSKYNKVVDELITVLGRHPGYRLYVTGHSLGGSLATLFAFQVAASTDPRIPKPVTCISIASLKVGDSSFQTAFHNLEQKRWIRCLRVENDMDVVPRFSFFNSRNYRHVGVGLRLYKDRTHKLKVHKGRKRVDAVVERAKLLWKFSAVVVDGGRGLLLESHSCPQHLHRLTRVRNELHRGRLSCFVRPGGYRVFRRSSAA